MSVLASDEHPVMRKALWAIVVLVGTISLGVVALNRGETINAAWLIIAAVCTYLLAYRFYGLFIANKLLRIDPARPTPAHRRNDGLDYVPTNRYVLFGHHFAAIAGAGPLVGPVLAAQMGYLPGTLWILVGVVFAGAVQDLTVMFLSVRRDGRSLGDMIRAEMGPVAGGIALVGVLLIMVILLAVLALVVVKALVGSPWGTFTVVCTLPIAMFMGIYLHHIRVGKVGEMSAIGFVLLMIALVYGKTVHETPALAAMFDWSGETLALAIIGYGFVASALAGLAAALPARLSLNLPQDRHDHAARDRHRAGAARSEDAGGHAVHRRDRPGVVGQPVPLPFHHHRLRRGVRFPLAHRVRHDAEDDRQ